MRPNLGRLQCQSRNKPIGYGSNAHSRNDVVFIKHHTIDASPSPSGGFIDIMFDEDYFKVENDVKWKWVCSDLNNFPPGLRIIYSDRTQIMRSHLTKLPSKPKSIEWNMFRWTTTKISSLRFAHRKSRENEDTEDRQVKWIHYDPSDFTWEYNNPVYGENRISPKMEVLRSC